MLQGVIDSARTLTGARYGGICRVDDAGQPTDLFFSGVTPEEQQELTQVPESYLFYQHLLGLPGPVRSDDGVAYFRSFGLPEFEPPMPTGAMMSTNLRRRGRVWGIIYLEKSVDDEEFSDEDQDILEMFASQASLVVANAYHYREQMKIQDRPGDADRYLTRRRYPLRHEDEDSFLQPGDAPNLRLHANVRQVGRIPAGSRDRPSRRRTGDSPVKCFPGRRR